MGSITAYRHTKNSLAAIAKFDLDDIEVLFSVLELDSEYVRRSNRSKKDDLTYMIVDILARRCSPKSVPWGTLDRRVQERLAKEYGLQISPSTSLDVNLYTYVVLASVGAFGAEEQDTSFVTFNYDLIIDTELEAFNIRPDYVLEGEYRKGIERVKRRVPLIKLHGSANWAICGERDCKIKPLFLGKQSQDVLQDT